MNINWSKLIIKLTFWAATEVMLNLVGLDSLANYSEFLMGDVSVVQMSHMMPAQGAIV